MDQWIEITEGDMQRMAENAFMFRCSKQTPWSYLCTHINDTRPFADAGKECYAKDVDGVEWFTPNITTAEFDALAQADVGKPVTPPTEPETPPVEEVADQAIYDIDLAQYYSQQLDTWGGITNATRYTASEKSAVTPFPPVDHPNAEWRTVPPL